MRSKLKRQDSNNKNNRLKQKFSRKLKFKKKKLKLKLNPNHNPVIKVLKMKKWKNLKKNCQNYRMKNRKLKTIKIIYQSLKRVKIKAKSRFKVNKLNMKWIMMLDHSLIRKQKIMKTLSSSMIKLISWSSTKRESKNVEKMKIRPKNDIKQTQNKEKLK